MDPFSPTAINYQCKVACKDKGEPIEVPNIPACESVCVGAVFHWEVLKNNPRFLNAQRSANKLKGLFIGAAMASVLCQN